MGACPLGCYLIFSDAFRFFEYFALAFDGSRKCSAISCALRSIKLIKVVTVSTKLLYPILINLSVLQPEQIGINYYKYQRQSRAAA